MINHQKSVELFHLLFLQHMNEKLEKALYAVKGGCNLRFFFKSIRYSEDLDIDVKTIAKETLRNKISKLLNSQQFEQTLSSKGLEIDTFSEVKQTETTQRWKLTIKSIDAEASIQTKIEFSRRTMEESAIFEPIDAELIHSYQLYPILCNHYTKESAFCQKVNALIHRTETQARDVFDLHLLIDRGIQPQCLPDPLRQEIDTALSNTCSISYSEFKSQVVAYLMKEYQAYYDLPTSWTEMQAKVVSALQKAKTA